MKIPIVEAYKPEDAHHWCAHCDHHMVDSDKPESGSFFVIFGHSYSQRKKSYDGEYTGVMFAICKHCMDTA